MSEFATLMGGTEITVGFRDNAAVGQQVFVRQLPIKLFPAYLASMQDECRQVALLCDKDQAWAESLTPASHEAVLEEGDKLNADFFSRWFERRKAREAKLPKPDLGEVVQMIEALSRSNPALLEELSRKAFGGVSKSSSPTSPPAAG